MTRPLAAWKAGETWTTPGRTVTESMVTDFAGLTGDVNPLHTDAEAAKEGPFGERVAHGMLTVSLAIGLWMRIPAFEGVALSGLDDVAFLAPVPFGDTIHVEIEVTGTEERERSGRVVVQNEVVNQDGETVATFAARLVVPK